MTHMIENENQQEQLPPQGKLVLPAIPDEEPRRFISSSQPRVRPDQLTQHKATLAPKSPLTKIGYYWRKDPAYKVVMIATVVVIIAGFIFVSLATAAFLHNPNLFSSANTTTPQSPTGPTPSGTVDLRPTFPTPGGGSGGNSSSQPPMGSTPVIQNTPVGSASPTPQTSPTPIPGGGSGGTLTVQITGIPGQVSNNSTVQVNVATSEPGVTVRLQVTYNVYPYYYQSGAQMTGGDGNATLDWRVQVSGFRVKRVTARVIAVATDGSGQYATSSAAFVQVFSSGGGLIQ